MTPSKIFLYFLLSFVGGVFLSSFFNVPKLIIWEFFILGVFYSLIFFKQKAIVVFAICLVILGLGILRTEISKDSESGSLSVLKREGYFSALKQKFREVIYQNFSPPQSSILVAILIGDKEKITQEWKEKLNIAGVRHITAISGMHIVILSQILLWLGIFLGLYRGQAIYFALAILWCYIFLIGFQPSAIRAGIMGSALLFCQKIGRQKAALNTLILAAVIMLAVKPSLFENIGFQLSFLATLGIVYLTPFFKNLFEKTKILKTFNLSSLLAMTFAAQIFTLPILIYNFGYLSLAGPVTNILIVPILPYLMGSGFLFLITATLWLPLGFIFSLPVWLFLNYLILVINFFSRFFWASLNFQISSFWLVVCYFFLGYFIWQLKKKEKLKLLNY